MQVLGEDGRICLYVNLTNLPFIPKSMNILPIPFEISQHSSTRGRKKEQRNDKHAVALHSEA